MNYFLFLPSVILFYFLLKYNYKIAEHFKLLDQPNIEKHKKHLVPVPATGGIFLFFFVLCYHLLHNNNNFTDYNFLFLFFGFFIIGLLDDIFKIKSYHRLIVLIILSYLYLLIDKEIIINSFYSDIFSQIIYTHFFNIIFTVICLVTIFIIFNMLDGIDGLMITYSLSIFVILLSIKFNLFILFASMLLLLLLYLNLNKKLFLGNSGVGILSAIIGYYLIDYSNFNPEKMSEVKILILLFLPFIDFLRLTFERLAMKKNPLKADNNHFHHFFFKKNLLLLLIPFYIIISYSLSFWIPILTLSISIILYSILLFRFRIKNE